MSNRRSSVYRFHLITAVLMACSSGVLLLVNFRQHFVTAESLEHPVVAGALERGWPFSAYKIDGLLVSETLPDYWNETNKRGTVRVEGHGFAFASSYSSGKLSRMNVLLNVLVGIAIVFGLGMVSEWLFFRQSEIGQSVSQAARSAGPNISQE